MRLAAVERTRRRACVICESTADDGCRSAYVGAGLKHKDSCPRDTGHTRPDVGRVVTTRPTPHIIESIVCAMHLCSAESAVTEVHRWVDN